MSHPNLVRAAAEDPLGGHESASTGDQLERKSIFISYRTNAEPDRTICDLIRRRLETLGHHVFIDRQIPPGLLWAAEIERGLREADVVILLLTRESAYSEMVLGEVERAHQIAKERDGLPRILPVRLAFQAPLPYPLNCYVGQIQHMYWGGERDSEVLLETLAHAIISGAVDRPGREPASETTSTQWRPLPQAPIPPPAGGTLDTEDRFYIVRDTDKQALRAISQTGGQTISIKGSRQSGKSSLLVRVAAAAENCGRHVAFLDLQLFGRSMRSDEAFFKHFIQGVAQQLGLHEGEDVEWHSGMSLAHNCTLFMEKRVLPILERPLTLACDEVDVVLGKPFQDEFFSMLRAWHNRRALYRAWKRLDIVLATSTEPYLFINRPDQSPFNVGTVLSLQDLTKAQIVHFNAIHGHPFSEPDLIRLYELTGGHPFLCRRALYEVSASGNAVDVEHFFCHAADDGGPFGDHLRRHLLKLLENPSVIPIFHQVLSGRSCGDDVAIHRLMGAGVVKQAGDKIVPRCAIYRDYFQRRLTNDE